MPKLPVNQEASVRKEIIRLNGELDKALETKNDLSDVIQQIDALRLEYTYFEDFCKEMEGRDENLKGRTFQPKVSARKLMHAWLAYEREVNRQSKTSVSKPSKHHVGFLEKIRLLLRFGMAGRIFFQLSIEERIPFLQRAYYLRKLSDLENRRKRLEASLAGFHFGQAS